MSSEAEKTAQKLNVASSVVDMGLGIAQTIAGISDMNKRRRFEEALALMSQRQQAQLNERLLKSNTQTERLAILSEDVVQFAIANENRIANKDTILYIIAGSLAVVILIAAIVYKVKTRK